MILMNWTFIYPSSSYRFVSSGDGGSSSSSSSKSALMLYMCLLHTDPSVY
jgi:hypothetical protein